ncbi:MAG: ubiquinone/menaquinone biosynthesis methyltransferase [Chloroflexi bacterium]|nr:MAG: ubiquinone/menaquinone biosynthesis methyltransferase [Chloroflexota bacterium]
MSKPEGGPLPPPERKVAFVRQLFTDIARRYDLMNRVMALGRDQSWRRYAVSQLGLNSGGSPRPEDGPQRVLDVASGTGDLALEVLRQQPRARVTGIDLVPDMLVVAQEKADRAGAPLPLTAGDALRLPFPDTSFDSVVTGFALRNVADIPAAFAEMARVTRPGGRVACLEFARPTLPIFRQLYHFYLHHVVPIIGVLLTGQRTAYTYLPHSVAAFLSPDQILVVMQRAGWQDVWYRRLMLGTVAVHVGVRGGG